MSEPPMKVLIDTDPGVDDAIALFLALRSREIEVIGLTTIFGNTHTDVTTRNALALLELAGADGIPVARGAADPIASAYLGAVEHVHGPQGQGDVVLPAASRPVADVPAWQFLHDACAASPGEVTVLTLGPLTNLAMALTRCPELPRLVRRVVAMGGNALVPGNASPAAEANVLNDPEAADLVFGQPWEVVMIGLDVTHQVNLTDAHLRQICSGDEPTSRHLAGCIPFYQAFSERAAGIDGIYAHDPTAVAYLLAPERFTLQHWPLRVETEGFSRGKTWPSLGNTDLPPAPWADRPGVGVATAVDGGAIRDLIVERLAG